MAFVGYPDCAFDQRGRVEGLDVQQDDIPVQSKRSSTPALFLAIISTFPHVGHNRCRENFSLISFSMVQLALFCIRVRMLEVQRVCGRYC